MIMANFARLYREALMAERDDCICVGCGEDCRSTIGLINHTADDCQSPAAQFLRALR